MSNNNSKDLLDGVKYVVKSNVDKASFDKTYTSAKIIGIDGTNKYHIIINGKEYHNVKSTSTATFKVNDLVDVLVPQNNFNNIRILNYGGGNSGEVPEGVSSVNGMIGDVTITKSTVGLALVDNVKQYSATNQPPYPVTSVNGKNGAVVLSASDVGALPSTTIVPTKTSQLTNDSNFVSDSNYVHTDNNFTDDYIEEIEDNTSGLASEITNRTNAINSLTTQVNGKLSLTGGTMSGNINMNAFTLNNLADATSNQQPATYKQLNEAIAGLGTVFDLKGSKADVSDLPTSGNEIGDVWYVEDESVGYIWIQDTSGTLRWEQFGQPIDLSGYLTSDGLLQNVGSSTTNTMSQNAITNALNNKVDKISGKGLSTNDFTNALLDKLNDLENFDPSGLEDDIAQNTTEIAKKANISDLADVATSGDYGDLDNKPTSLPPSGVAGGDLSGTYPNPTIRDNSHNHTIENVTNLQTQLNLKANLSSPTFSGTPTAPTPTMGDSSNKIATTEFVGEAIENGDFLPDDTLFRANSTEVSVTSPQLDAETLDGYNSDYFTHVVISNDTPTNMRNNDLWFDVL